MNRLLSVVVTGLARVPCACRDEPINDKFENNFNVCSLRLQG